MNSGNEAIPEALNRLSERVIGAAIEVHRQLGPGFQEITYRRALEIELEQLGIGFEAEVPVRVQYRGRVIGEGRIDLLIEGGLISGIKGSGVQSQEISASDTRLFEGNGLAFGFSDQFRSEPIG